MYKRQQISIAVPWRIGCGLAGGEWATYRRIIENWARAMPAKTGKHVSVNIYIFNKGGRRYVNNVVTTPAASPSPARSTIKRMARRAGILRAKGVQYELPTGEHEGPAPTPSARKRTKGWALHTEVKASQISGAGLGLFMLETAKAGERVARYYGELLGPKEAAIRKAAGSQYILRANSKQFIDAAAHPDQRGRYANDGGKNNNARIATTVNTCPITGMHWVSITARKRIRAGDEVLVPYGRSFERPWRAKAAPAMAYMAAVADTTRAAANTAYEYVRGVLGSAMRTLTNAPAEAREHVATLWERARDFVKQGRVKEHNKTCDRIAEVIIDIHDYEHGPWHGDQFDDNPGSMTTADNHSGSMTADNNPGSMTADDHPGSMTKADNHSGSMTANSNPGSMTNAENHPGSNVDDDYDPGSHPGSSHDSASIIDTDEDHRSDWAFHHYMGVPTPVVKVSVSPPRRPPSASFVSLGGGVRLRTSSGLGHRRR